MGRADVPPLSQCSEPNGRLIECSVLRAAPAVAGTRSPSMSLGHVCRLRCLRPRLQRHDAVQLLAQGPALEPELIVALQVHPQLGRCAEVLGQSYSGVRGDAALAVHDLVDAARGHADGRGELVLGEPEPLDEVLDNDLARVNRVDLVGVGGSRRLDIIRTSSVMAPRRKCPGDCS